MNTLTPTQARTHMHTNMNVHIYIIHLYIYRHTRVYAYRQECAYQAHALLIIEHWANIHRYIYRHIYLHTYIYAYIHTHVQGQDRSSEPLLSNKSIDSMQTYWCTPTRAHVPSPQQSCLAPGKYIHMYIGQYIHMYIYKHIYIYMYIHM